MAAPVLMTTAEVAGVFRVDPKTVARWGATGKLAVVYTLGTPRQGAPLRFYRAEVDALLAGTPLTAAQVRALSEGSHA